MSILGYEELPIQLKDAFGVSTQCSREKYSLSPAAQLAMANAAIRICVPDDKKDKPLRAPVV
ncbi:hypothetical protein E4U17_001397 [Claviceps sp. LM77 group G4]|nr:hypothetical protein E4U17_001397 [Claviceps sp. LM77 group G4]KAG6078710.1 hypothetical protein E4U16_001512 [Claviceps sp. LM84 group G4]KAG6079440.1 hypothetical protein E4U33_000180 [Claviceps sp. LM78 group G4]